MRYLSVSEVAGKWGISERSVRNYCAAGRISGAFLTGKTWNIPAQAEKPERINKRKHQAAMDGQQEMECAQEPKLLFKYRSVKTTEELCRLIRILEDKKIYFPSVQELNDSLEGTGTALLSLGEGIYESSMRKAYHVLSFTENCFSPVMWSHYGGDRTGVCIGFFKKGRSCDDENGNFLKIARKINYVDSRNMLSAAEEDTAIKSDLFFKHRDWSYEREWRIIAKDGNEAIVPDEEGNPFFQFESEDVACLILGEKMDPMLRKAITALASNIPIYTIACEFQTYDYSVKNNETGKNVCCTTELYEDLQTR